MVKYLALLSFICILTSCNNQNDKSNFAQLIKGDWVGQQQSDGLEHDLTEFLLFEDSTCRVAFQHDLLGYEILEDTLYIKSLKNMKAPVDRLTIGKLTTDSLILLSGRKQQDTTIYTKVRPKNNITPAAIYFASSGCLHDCLVTQLEIDSNRNVRFYGHSPGLTTGGYTGKLNEVEYNVIISKIRNLPVDSLQNYYEESGTDLETLGIAIAHDNKITRSSVYGEEAVPIELNILLIKLMNQAHEIHLQPDSSVKNENFIQHPQLKPITNLLAPPPPTIRKFTPPKVDN
jgi:hypothetical protein